MTHRTRLRGGRRSTRTSTPALAELDADGQTVTVAAACTETGVVEAFGVG